MYKIEKGKPYYYPLATLVYFYIVPRSFEESYLKNFSIKFTAIMLFKFFVGCVMPILHLTMSLKDKTGVDISEDITIFLGEFSCVITIFPFIWQYKKWSKFCIELTAFKKNPANIETFVRNFYRLSIICFYYVLTGIILYGMGSLSESSQCKQLNEEKGLRESCFAYQSVWFPFDTNDIFSAIAIFMVQLIVVIHLVPPTALIFFIVLESTELLILHIDILKENLINLFEKTPNQEISSKLRFCIIYHNHILRLCERFNTLQKYCVGYVSIIAALGFGCILNQIQNTKPIGAAVYLLGCITSVAVTCHCGQRIIDQTRSVGDAAYASDWKEADPQTIKDLAFIMMRSQTPVHLNCIPLGIFHYDLFLKIMKASYSYLTLLDGAT